MEASTQAQAVPYTWPDIAVVNDKSSGMTDDEVKPIVDALARQVLYDFGPRWHIGAHLHFVGAGSAPPAGMWTLVVLDSSDVAGALGYHDLTPDGLPLGKVFAGTDRQFGEMVSVTLSHELLEMLADPWISLTAQDERGVFWAWEDCDPVEADGLGYQVDGVQMSAFVTPAWFGTGSGDVSFPAGRVSRPFEIAPGGYMSVFNPSSGQGWTQIQERRAQIEGLGPPEGHTWPTLTRGEGPTPAELIKSVPRVGSRRERRFRGKDGWVLSTYNPG